MASNKILRINDLWANIKSLMTKSQVAYTTDTVNESDLKFGAGTSVHRDSADTFHIGAEQYKVDANTLAVTPASNDMGSLELLDTDNALKLADNTYVNNKSADGTGSLFITNDATPALPNGGVGVELISKAINVKSGSSSVVTIGESSITSTVLNPADATQYSKVSQNPAQTEVEVGLAGGDTGIAFLADKDNTIIRDATSSNELKIDATKATFNARVSGSEGTDAGDFITLTQLETATATSGVTVTSPSTESVSGTATKQNTANTEAVSAITANSEAIEAIEGASMKVAELGGTFATTETTFDFDTVTASDNTDLLDANDTTNIVTFKKQLRYAFQTYIAVNTTGAGDKTLTLRIRNNAGDALLSSRDVEIDGGRNRKQTFSLDPIYFDNPIDDLEVYFTAECTDTEVDLIELNTTITTGSGSGGGGIWEVNNGEIDNVGQRPVNVEVATTAPAGLTVTGTGTSFDTTYVDTGNLDDLGYENTLSDGVNTAIRGTTNNYWCLVAGVTTVNPIFFNSSFYNTTGSIEGIYIDPAFINPNGTGTLLSTGSAGGRAIVANSDIVAPVFEITDKSSRRWNTDDYLADNILEPATGAVYAMVANGTPRFAIPVAGSGNHANLYRSVVLGGQNNDDPNLSTNIANTIYDETFIPCNTDTTGADLGVSGSAQIVKKLLIGLSQSTGFRIIADAVSAITTWTDSTYYSVMTSGILTLRNASQSIQNKLSVTDGVTLLDTAQQAFTQLYDGILSHQDGADTVQIDMNDGNIEIHEAVSANTPAEITTLGVKAFQTEESIRETTVIEDTGEFVVNANCSLTKERIAYNATTITLYLVVVVNTGTSTLGTLGGEYRPPMSMTETVDNLAGTSVTVLLSSSTGTMNRAGGGNIPAGTYYITTTYPKS